MEARYFRPHQRIDRMTPEQRARLTDRELQELVHDEMTRVFVGAGLMHDPAPESEEKRARYSLELPMRIRLWVGSQLEEEEGADDVS